MQLPLQCDADSTLSLQDQLFSQIRQLILNGCLTPGTRMPASRMLASDLKVSRNTVVLTYDRLIAGGYLESHHPVGTFVASDFVPDDVCSPAPDALIQTGKNNGKLLKSPPKRAPVHFKGKPHVVVSPYKTEVPYDFLVGRPDARLFPIKDWMQNMRRKLRDMQEGNSVYVEPSGLPRLREAVAHYVGGARGIQADPEQIVIVNGTQEALTLLSQLFIREGTPVATENPCYQGAANVFASHGASLHPVPVDSEGIAVEKLPSKASLVYLTPAHQYPTGAMLSPARRRRLLRWCYSTGAYALEDDYNSDFCYDTTPLPALKSQDTADQVIYLGTFSKSLGAGLRAGYMVVPRHLVGPLTVAKGLLNNCSGWAVQALLAEFLISGEYTDHLRRIRTRYKARRNRLLSLLDRYGAKGCIHGAHGGMHIAWELPPGWPTAAQLEVQARDRGVGVYGLQAAGVYIAGRQAESRYQSTVLFGYAALDRGEIAAGIKRLVEQQDTRSEVPRTVSANA